MGETLFPPDSHKRFDEVIHERKILTIRELAEISQKEGWSFGFGCDLLDYILAKTDLGKVSILQRFSAHEANHTATYIVSASLLRRQEPLQSG